MKPKKLTKEERIEIREFIDLVRADTYGCNAKERFKDGLKLVRRYIKRGFDDSIERMDALEAECAGLREQNEKLDTHAQDEIHRLDGLLDDALAQLAATAKVLAEFRAAKAWFGSDNYDDGPEIRAKFELADSNASLLDDLPDRARAMLAVIKETEDYLDQPYWNRDIRPLRAAVANYNKRGE